MKKKKISVSPHWFSATQLIVVLLIAIASLYWIEPLYAYIAITSFLGNKFIVPLLNFPESEIKTTESSIEKELNVNENIAKYKAKLKERKEHKKWWQFWL